MRLHCHLLVAMMSSLTISSALATEFDQTKISSVISHHSGAMGHTQTINERMLRGVHVDGYEVEDGNMKEDRGPVTTFTTLFTSIGEKLTPLNTKLKTWAQLDSGVDELKVLLKMDKVADNQLESAKNFKRYDELVSAKIPLWSQRDLSSDDVLKRLGIARLTGEYLRRNPNYKYYVEYFRYQVPVWSKNDVDPKEVLHKLGMGSLSQKNLGASPNFVFYDEFVSRQIPKWIERGYSPAKVQTMLGMNKVSYEDFQFVPSHKFYINFMQQKTQSWALTGVPEQEVKVKLGLATLSDEAVMKHPNFQYINDYVKKKEGAFQIKEWMGSDTPVSSVWSSLGLGEIASKSPKTMKDTAEFKLFAWYVRQVDNNGVVLHKTGHPVPDMIRMGGSAAEMSAKAQIWASTHRTEEYVKWALGIDKLTGRALTKNEAYKYFLEFLRAKKIAPALAAAAA
ncbi:Avr1b-1 Avirulence-like protein [Phytophthora palmivora]|uniref:Avr1b-1 Avirulence-like protein n=1 Tax=Phytophthora palmivora TaxID=4796 RepID=A0A2P4YTC5_9STRA|nr:Avr1b-1 Avirulence-like protein [Phytophthora palmivora]